MGMSPPDIGRRRPDRPVDSFGRRGPENPADQVVLLPTLALGPIQLPLVLVIDETALQDAADTITAMVAAAVRRGFELAGADFGADPDETTAGD
jgi:hypothetical protein